MKTILQKISILVFLACTTLVLNAQTIQVSAKLAGQTTIIASGTTFDATVGGFVTNLNAYLPGTLWIKNTGSSALILTLNGSSYLTLSGTSPADFTASLSSTYTGFNGTIAPGDSVIYNVTVGSGATNGANKTLTIGINSNVPSYTGSIKYSFSGITTTATVNAIDIGLSVYPNPSINGGTFLIKSPNVNVNRIVISNSAGVTEEFAGVTSFTTKLKGILLVQLYTDNGLVYDKLIVQ